MATTSTSKPSWTESLAATLATVRARKNPLPPKPENAPVRVAVVGIGNDLRGDDAAGVIVARTLQENTPHPLPFPHRGGKGEENTPLPPCGGGVGGGGCSLLIIDAGQAPENCTGPIRRFGPDLVILVDAAQMDESPGAIRWLAWQETSGLSASTHTLPSYVLAQYLTAEFGCDVALIGIQPATFALEAPLSPAVHGAVEAVIVGLRETLG